MTVFGQDHIPYDELDLRLSQFDEDLMNRVQETTEESPLTNLMIGFFFKGGHKELGAEFLHKSFREYLYAECIVESLKKYGQQVKLELAEREPYWKDFAHEDPRHDFSRRLGELLAPQWITQEIATFLQGLIEWELHRAHKKIDTPDIGYPTEALDLSAWKIVRDGLADVWDWWAEGVHLREQPIYKGKRFENWQQPYAADLVKWALPQKSTEQALFPIRYTTMDSHLGDGICRLTSLVHHFFAVQPELEPNWEYSYINGNKIVRRYQSIGLIAGNECIRFKPSGELRENFMNFSSRINSAGWRPFGGFPSGLFLDSSDFSSITLCSLSIYNVSLRGVNFSGSLLENLFFDSCNLNYSKIIDSAWSFSKVCKSNLDNTDFTNTHVNESHFINCDLSNTLPFKNREW